MLNLPVGAITRTRLRPYKDDRSIWISPQEDKDAPLQATVDFNYQVFAEDIEIVERHFPEDLPIDSS